MGELWKETALAAAAASLILLLEHYWLPHQRLHPMARYVMGILALHLPMTALLIAWKSWHALIALWVITGMGGLTVTASYLVDLWRQVRARLAISEREAEALRQEVGRGQVEGR